MKADDGSGNSGGSSGGIPAETGNFPPENGLNRMEGNGREGNRSPTVDAEAAAAESRYRAREPIEDHFVVWIDEAGEVPAASWLALTPTTSGAPT